MLNLLPASVSAAIDPWLTGLAAVAYGVYGVRRWRSRSWGLRFMYLLGGAVLAVYDLHMVWWIEAMGLALIVVASLGGPAGRSQAGPAAVSDGTGPG